jgi:hypothetical protein
LNFFFRLLVLKMMTMMKMDCFVMNYETYVRAVQILVKSLNSLKVDNFHGLGMLLCLCEYMCYCCWLLLTLLAC